MLLETQVKSTAEVTRKVLLLLLLLLLLLSSSSSSSSSSFSSSVCPRMEMSKPGREKKPRLGREAMSMDGGLGRVGGSLVVSGEGIGAGGSTTGEGGGGRGEGGRWVGSTWRTGVPSKAR